MLFGLDLKAFHLPAPICPMKLAIPSQATIVFLPNFQLVRVKLCFCMCHLVSFCETTKNGDGEPAGLPADVVNYRLHSTQGFCGSIFHVG